MPSNITIAAFVLGSVLLLIAILHGSFKIFGAEVDGSPGRFGRIFAGLLGVILIGIGLLGSFGKSLMPSPPGPQKATSESSKPAGDSSESTPSKQIEAQPPSGQNIDIAGTWHDSEGSVFLISQQGDKFSIRITGMHFTATSSGVLRGHEVERTYETLYEDKTRVSGHCSGTISSDLNLIRATCFETNGGPWESILVR